MMKQTILINWNVIRALRLIMGVVVLMQAVGNGDILLGMAGLIFAAMAVFNMGCCGAGACAIPTKKTSGTLNETSYEEVV